MCFFFQAEDGIRDYKVTGVQTCALPISAGTRARMATAYMLMVTSAAGPSRWAPRMRRVPSSTRTLNPEPPSPRRQIGRASGRERGEISVGAGSLKKKNKEVD